MQIDLPGWWTELGVLAETGSTVEHRGDHLVVRSPENPTFHWGNCLFVLDATTVHDAPRWLDLFRREFPDATWVAIGLCELPADVDAWTSRGVQVELDDVLTTSTLPRRTPPPAGYTIRELSGDADWERHVAHELRENDRTGEYAREAFRPFVLARTRSQRAMCERGVAAWFGAFVDDLLVADLGIVRCGTTARYQTVGTDFEHRRRGLATHLLGAAAVWSADRGCDRWVIVTEASNPAGRVYRSVGFAPDTGNARAYRPPR